MIPPLPHAPASSSPRSAPPRPHEPLLTLILPLRDPPASLDALDQVERALPDTPHEIIAIYDDASRDALIAVEAMSSRPPTLRLVSSDNRSALAAAAPLAAGDVLLLLDSTPFSSLKPLASALRTGRCAIAIATPSPRPSARLALLDFLLAIFAGAPVWNALSGHRAYAAAFLDRLDIESRSDLALRAELLTKAQWLNAPIGTVRIPLPSTAPAASDPPRTTPADFREAARWLREALWAPLAVWGLWMVMSITAFLAAAWPLKTFSPGTLANVALPAAGVFAFTLAVRRIRGRTRLADAFFSLVLLNPLFITRGTSPFDPTLLAAGLLGLMAGAIIAMKRDTLHRYLAVIALALLLGAVSDAFVLLLPPLAFWLILVGYALAKSKTPAQRTRGFIILAAAEVALLTFCLAAILIEPTTAPHPRTLFTTIVSFTEFPLLVLAIILLALGWQPAPAFDFAPLPSPQPPPPSPSLRPHPRKRNPRGNAPPYFAGMLAFLLGLLAMLLNNFQSGTLPSPGADQTVLILCLLYTISALHAPRHLHVILPPLLLTAAAAYTFWR